MVDQTILGFEIQFFHFFLSYKNTQLSACQDRGTQLAAVQWESKCCLPMPRQTLSLAFIKAAHAGVRTSPG